jgi:hypothetical protein
VSDKEPEKRNGKNMGAKGGKGERTGQVRRGVPFSRPLPGPCRRVAAQGQPVTKYKLFPLGDSQIMQNFLTFFYITILLASPLSPESPLPCLPSSSTPVLPISQTSPTLSTLLPHHSALPSPDHAQIACFALLLQRTPTSTGAVVVVVVETRFFSRVFLWPRQQFAGSTW